MKVQYLPEVEIYLFDLIELLYRNKYFSFPDQAIDYVQRIRSYIENTIETAYKRKAPEHFTKYGDDMSYFTYKANNRTTWYVFFQQKQDAYLIRYITNNHIAAQYFV
jgi:hypothetical protein